ncbi:MAG: HEAT repeat domain-containing protein [Opitutae bacterium]|nr:HEAT repeat domain-containing protein [Opitutae bacterium]
MPAAPPASDAGLLTIIVDACYVLAGAALLIWCGVFLVRIRQLRSAKREAVAEERLTGLVLDQISGYQPTPGIDRFGSLAGWERRLLLRVLRNLIEQTKGRDQSHLIRLLQRTGFQERAFIELARGPAAQRQAAGEILAFFDDAASIAALHAARHDRDRGVRQTALRALLAKDQVSSLRELLEQLDVSPQDPPLSLAEIFSQLPARLHPEAIARLEGGQLPPEWRRMLAIALGRKQVLAAFDALAALRHSPAPRVRAASWVALAELGDPRVGDFVHEGLEDESPDVRQAACHCAGKLGGPSTPPNLARRLDDPDWWVRYQAARALLEFGDAGRQLLEEHSGTASEEDAGWQVLHEPEDRPHAG